MDQIFSVQAALISRHTFDSPSELVDILDSGARPEDPGEQQRRQRQQPGNVECEAYKLDEVADWKQWTSMLGVRLKGLSISVIPLSIFCQSPKVFWFMFAFTGVKDFFWKPPALRKSWSDPI